MSSRSINRKDFLVLTVSSTAIAAFLQGCGDDPATPIGTAGTSTAGTATAGTPATGGTGTAGTPATGGTGTAGTPATGGTGTAGTGTGGASGGSGGAAAGSGGASGGKGGTGGASGGSGGASGGSGGSGGASSGMCGTVSTITQTSTEGHDHIPADATMLKADLKTLINGAMPTMNFNVPMDGNHTHVLKLTQQEAMTLKAGGMITNKKTETDATTHTHTYTIACTA